jgi:hypothetical protein
MMMYHVVLYKLADKSEVLIIYIIRAMMVGIKSTPETSVTIYETTWHRIPEGSHLHTCNCENLKSQLQSPLTKPKPPSEVRNLFREEGMYRSIKK